jgi:hypothetical protein
MEPPKKKEEEEEDDDGDDDDDDDDMKKKCVARGARGCARTCARALRAFRRLACVHE